MNTRKTPIFLLFLALLAIFAPAAACGSGGSGGSGGGSGVCFDYADFTGDSPTVSFKTDVLPILRTSCGLSSSCHGSETAPGPGQPYFGASISSGDMTADQIKKIFDQSLNKASVANPDMKVINANHPETSFLLFKLDGDPTLGGNQLCDTLTCAADKSCGVSMPQGGPTLPAASRDIIRRWIAQGAKNDG